MKMSNNYKKLCLALGLTTVISAGVIDAANYTKTLKATFRDIKVTYNGVVKNVPEPFAVDGTTYLPVRAISEVLNAGVNWDAATSTVKITQAPTNTAEIESLKQQLNTATYELAVAQREVQQLKAQLEEDDKNDDTSTGTDISDSAVKKTLGIIEDTFEDEYRIEWSFDLVKTSSGKLDLEISYDSRDDEARFNHLSSSELEDFVEDICETIRTYHDNIEIIGSIADSRSDWEKGDFVYSKSDKMDFSLMSDDFFYTERDLKRYYSKFDNVPYKQDNVDKTADIIIDSFKLETGNRSLMFTVNVSFDASEQLAWNAISNSDNDLIEKVLYDIKLDIESEYDKIDVEGQIVNNSGQPIAVMDVNGRFSYY